MKKLNSLLLLLMLCVPITYAQTSLKNDVHKIRQELAKEELNTTHFSKMSVDPLSKSSERFATQGSKTIKQKLSSPDKEEFNARKEKLAKSLALKSVESGTELLDSIIGKNGSGIFRYKAIYKYDKKGNNILFEEYKYSTETNSWIGIGIKETYEYDKSNNITLLEEYFWDIDSNDWFMNLRVKSSYTQHNSISHQEIYVSLIDDFGEVTWNLLEETTYEYKMLSINGEDVEVNTESIKRGLNTITMEFENMEKQRLIYDDKGNLVSVETYKWVEFMSIGYWLGQDARREKIFDDNNREIGYTTYSDQPYVDEDGEIVNYWLPVDKKITKHDDTGELLLLEVSSSNWDADEERWGTIKQTTYLYSDDKTVNSSETNVWDYQSEAWRLAEKGEYSYTVSGNLTLFESYTWDSESSSFFKKEKEEYSYDANENNILLIKYTGTSTNTWLGSYKEEWTYENNYPSSSHYYSWINNAWESTQKGIYEYDENGYNTYIERYAFENNNWRGITKAIYEKDNVDRLLHSKSYGWVNGAWELRAEGRYAYDDNGNNTYSEQKYYDEDWAESYKSIFQFNENGDWFTREYYGWDKDTQTWYGKIGYTYEYNESGEVTSAMVFGWHPTAKAWYLDSEDIYFYSNSYLTSIPSTPSNNSTNNVFVDSSSNLWVNSPSAETVSVYTVSGVKLISVEKDAEKLHIELGNLPKGIIIVRGSTGWVSKAIVK